MKTIVFDSGPLISLTLNNVLWLLEPLKEKFKGDFYISRAVKNEVIEKPISTKRFEFEALQLIRYVEKGILTVNDDDAIHQKTLRLLDLANNVFMAQNHSMNIVHYAEMSGLATCLQFGSNIFVVDERTTRLLVEDPKKLRLILSHKLHTRVDVNADNLKTFRNLTKNIKLIRSVELVTIAFELGLLDDFIPHMPNGRRMLLESLIWGVKLDGCAVSRREIDQIIRLERV